MRRRPARERRRVAYVRRYRHLDAWCGRRAEAAYTVIVPRGWPARPPVRRGGRCGNLWCRGRVGARRVTLLNPDGSECRACVRRCEDCTDVLLRGLIASYGGGEPAYRVDTAEDRRTA